MALKPGRYFSDEVMSEAEESEIVYRMRRAAFRQALLWIIVVIATAISFALAVFVIIHKIVCPAA